MGWSEQRGTFWRARWIAPNGKTESVSGFLNKKAADKYWQRQEADIDANRYVDPRAGQILFEDWVNTWFPTLDLELSTLETRMYHLEMWALPTFQGRSLAAIASAPEEIDAWELAMVAEGGVSKRTARDVRSTLATCLQAAVRGKRIPTNPAIRERATGKKATRRMARREHKRKPWVTPLEGFLLAERAAVLSGRDDEFVELITILYTGLRWSESKGLHPDLLHEGRWDIDWKLYELNGKFYRQYPKDGSVRAIDTPPFLDALVGTHLGRMGTTRCACDPATEDPYCTGGAYTFLGPGRTHARRSDFARRFFRPAADGRYPAQGGRRPRPATPVLVDTSSSWPGVAAPASFADGVFEVPASRGILRRPEQLPVNSRSKRDALIVYAVDQGMTLEAAEALTREQLLDRFVRSSYLPEGAEWGAMWLPVKLGITPHGLRRSHETWMAEDRIADVLRDDRMGHIGEDDDPETKRSMRDRYTEISDTMRGELVDSLQKRWERSLVERVELEQIWFRDSGQTPQSPLRIVNEILRPYREEGVTGISRPTRRLRAAPQGRRRLSSATG
jgi:integrase